MTKKFLFFTSFIVIVLFFIVFIIYREGSFSKQVLRLEILGPDSANIGEEIEYTVKYKNNGKFVLEKPKLTFDFPENSITDDKKNKIVKDFDDIYPGEENFIKIKVRLNGKEGDLKSARAYLSYTPKNLSARLESDTTFITKIKEVPITLNFDISTKAEKGKDFEYSLNYFSNVDLSLENLSIKIIPANGFQIQDSSPHSLDNIEWKLKTLNKSEGGRIIINGKINSDAPDKMNFFAQLGMWQDSNFIVIKEASVEIETTQSMLFISQQINGSSSYVASPGETLNYKIFFRNIGSSAFENLFMIVNLSGDAFDMSTIRSNSGQVQQSGNMIVWDSKEIDQLKKLNVQQEASVEFSVKIKNDWMPVNSNLEDMTISNQVNISQITKKFTIKVNSGLVVSQTATLNSDNKYLNPTANKETFYMISWNIINYSGDVKNVKIRAVLPENVKLTGKIFPTTEFSNFSFDSNSREVVWSAGNILSNTGVNGDPIGISFEISLTPLSSQVGSVALLAGQAIIEGENQFTGTNSTSKTSGIDTTLNGAVSGIVQ